MKTFLRSAVAVAALAVAMPAFAADLGYSTPVYSAPIEAAPVAVEPTYDATYDWSGFYAGVLAGHTWADTEHYVPGSGEFDAAGYLLGATVGYNYQIDNIVLGAEADLAWSDLNGSNGTYSTEVEWNSSLRARAGYAFGNILPYVTGGFALADIKGNGPGYSTNERQFGLVAGAGVEVGVTENISLKAEYLYTDFYENNVISNNAAQSIDLKGHSVRTGIAFSF